MSRKYKNILIVGILINIVIESQAVLWPCESNNDCTAENSECSLDSGECKCPEFGFVFSDDFTKCLKTAHIGESCEYNAQCNLMPVGAICKAGICDCSTGLTYIQGQCQSLKNLDQPCEKDLDCYFGYDRASVVCQNHLCSCASGYYRRYASICRRKSMDENDDCVIDSDCDQIGPNVHCNNYKCVSINEKVYNASTTTFLSKTKNNISLPKQLKRFSSLQQSEYTTIKPIQLQDIHESDTENVETANERIKKPTHSDISSEKLVFNLKNITTPIISLNQTKFVWRDDVNESWSTESNTDNNNGAERIQFGDFCAENGMPCSGIYHSICSNNICLCKKGYYNQNGECFAELGENAETANQCDFQYDSDTKKCVCQNNYFYERSLRACRKPIEFHLSCTSNSQCSPFGASYCTAEFPRRCTCFEYAEYNELEQMCINKQGLGAECDSIDDCIIDNTVCSDRKCICSDKFFEKEGLCVPGIGATCQSDVDCISSNSECKIDEENSKLCQCRKGFVHFKDECLKEAENLGEECLDSEQCKLLSASCIDSKCSCTEQQHLQFGHCENKKLLGEACSRAGECFIEKEPENVECRNLVCQCKFEYQANIDKKTCISAKKNSSGRPSALKYITFILIGTAFFVTSAAIRQALTS